MINQWNVTSLDFVVGSLVAYDTTSAQLYSRTPPPSHPLAVRTRASFLTFADTDIVIGSGNGPPVALVSASTTSGQLEHYSYFQTNQPSGLFCL